MSDKQANRGIDRWDVRFLLLARHLSKWGADQRTQGGAVIVDPLRRPVSFWYDELPQGVTDDTHESLHAETNAIMFATQSMRECTLYAWPRQPCPLCAALIVQAGITRVVAPLELSEDWKARLDQATRFYREAGVVLQLFTPQHVKAAA
jgi:dCMP deaminase